MILFVFGRTYDLQEVYQMIEFSHKMSSAGYGETTAAIYIAELSKL